MAVQPQTPYKEYTANGSTNSFALEFDCDNQDHLIVLVDDIELVVGAWSLIGGAVVFETAPTNGKKITIQRNTPFRRDGDFQSYDNSFRPGPVNKGFDKIWLKLQELGVADWILSTRIDALKNYVDRKDDELKGYLLEEIRKQGVALDQLEDYYNYLMQRLAQIAVDKGWDASFVVDGNENQHQINRTTIRTVNSIADMVAINNPKHGQVVDVASYYVDENKGGDNFYFDSTKAAINNGVTIFNGWVRDLSDKILTTDDAGLIDNAGVDQKIKLQALADALQGTNSFTLKVTGKHLTSTNIIFNDAVGLRVVGNGEISAKELREQWSFKRTTGSRGVFLFEDCPYLRVDSNLKIVGAKKQYLTAPEPWEDGDCPIQLIRCPHALIQSGDFSHSIAWGVLAENSPYTIVNNNDIYDIVRQSGVNIVIGGGTQCKVTNNRIRDVGLYGVEWETYNDCSDFEESGNVIWDCQKGSALVKHLISGNIHDNVYRFCNEGVTAYPLSQSEKTKGINVHNNQVFGCVIGLYAVQSNDVLFYNNLVSMKIANDLYFKTSSYNSIVAVESSNQILVLPNSTFNVGSTDIDVKINNVQTVILSVVSIVDNRLGTSTLKRLVLRDPIVNMQDGDFILRKCPIDGDYRGLFAADVNSNIIFKDNTVFNYYTAMQSESNYTTSDNQELFIDNKVFDCVNFFALPFVSQGVKVKNTFRQGGNIIIANQSIKSTLLPSASINVVNVESRSSGAGDYPIQYFSTIDNSLIVSCQIAFDSSFASSEDVVIRVDGSDAFTVPSSSFGSNKSFIDYNLLDLSAGNHNVQVVDTAGNLRYKSWSIKFNTV